MLQEKAATCTITACGSGSGDVGVGVSGMNTCALLARQSRCDLY